MLDIFVKQVFKPEEQKGYFVYYKSPTPRPSQGLQPELREPIQSHKKALHYLDELGPPSPWLFPSADDPEEHINRVRAHNILNEAFEAIGIDCASSHSMRLTCLTNMSRAGIPLSAIQEISGHSNLGQLQEYLAVDPADSHRAIMSLKY